MYGRPGYQVVLDAVAIAVLVEHRGVVIEILQGYNYPRLPLQPLQGARLRSLHLEG